MKNKCCLPKALPGSGGKPSFGQKECPALQSFVSRDIAGTDPNSEQFAPTEGDLLPRRQKMAGMS